MAHDLPLCPVGTRWRLGVKGTAPRSPFSLLYIHMSERRLRQHRMNIQWTTSDLYFAFSLISSKRSKGVFKLVCVRLSVCVRTQNSPLMRGRVAGGFVSEFRRPPVTYNCGNMFGSRKKCTPLLFRRQRNQQQRRIVAAIVRLESSFRRGG